MGAEGSFRDSYENNHHLGNIFEAFYQILQAIEGGAPYSGIDGYEAAVGKRITGVLAEKPGSGKVFYNLDLPNSKYKNCFNQTLYLTALSRAISVLDSQLPPSKQLQIPKSFSVFTLEKLKTMTERHSVQQRILE